MKYDVKKTVPALLNWELGRYDQKNASYRQQHTLLPYTL